MTYTITWTRAKKRVVLKSFAGMVLWASCPEWQWAVGASVERLVAWVSNPPGHDTKVARYAGAMRWEVSE